MTKANKKKVGVREKGKWKEHSDREKERCKETIIQGETLARQNEKLDHALKAGKG